MTPQVLTPDDVVAAAVTVEAATGRSRRARSSGTSSRRSRTCSALQARQGL